LGYPVVGRSDRKGGYLVTLDQHVINRFKARRDLQGRDPAGGEGLKK
jgi:hypothetical protein